MKGQLNHQALAARQVRSGSIGALGVVLHPVTEPGHYEGHVFENGREAFALRLNVDEKHSPGQLDIDLSRRHVARRNNDAEVSFTMHPGEYLVLFSRSGHGGYHLVLHKAGKDPGKVARVFDSRSLSTNDLFAVTLLRPGMYSITDELGQASGKLRVSYPVGIEGTPTRREPVNVAVSDGKLDPGTIEVKPAQPIVFAIGARESAIALKLVEPDNGPKRKERTKTGARDREKGATTSDGTDR